MLLGELHGMERPKSDCKMQWDLTTKKVKRCLYCDVKAFIAAHPSISSHIQNQITRVDIKIWTETKDEQPFLLNEYSI